MFTRVVELTSKSGKARELSPRRIVRARSVGHPLAYPRMPAPLSICTHDDWSALGFNSRRFLSPQAKLDYLCHNSLPPIANTSCQVCTFAPPLKQSCVEITRWMFVDQRKLRSCKWAQRFPRGQCMNDWQNDVASAPLVC